jgi:hypothetical protein
MKKHLKKTYKKRKNILKKRKTYKQKFIKGGDDKECPICFEKLDNPDNNINLSCNHIFHKLCLKESFQKGIRGCPLCRKPINEDEMYEMGIYSGKRYRSVNSRNR